MLTTLFLTFTAAAGASAAAAEKAGKKEPDPTLLEIVERVRQYANCDRLPLLERPGCAKDFAIKSLKLGVGVGLFLYVTQEAMKDHGASFGKLNKELAALEKLRPALLLDPSKEPDPEQRRKILEQSVRTLKEAEPLLDSLGDDLAKASRLIGAHGKSLEALAVLTVAVGDHYPEYKPPKDVDTKPAIDFGKELAELNKVFDRMIEGMDKANRGLDQMNEGVKEVNGGLEQMNGGISKANRGMEQLNQGISEAGRGMEQLNKAVPGIKDGALKLRELPDIDFDFSHIGDVLGGTSAAEQAEQQRRMSLLLDLLPGIGDGKGIVEAIMGKDMATGEELTTTDRVLGSLVVLHWLKSGGKVLTAEEIREARKSEKIAMCAANSFPAGTFVLMADGTRTPIEQVHVGDKVVAADLETGQNQVEQVTDLITGEGVKHLVKITVDTDGDSGDQTADIVATDHHPFRTEHPDHWADAADLESGMWLRGDNGTHVRITNVDAWTAQEKVYNLTVDELHTYYVLAGSTPLLVHNAKKDKCSLLIDHVGQVDQDWVTKGAHVNMKDGMEVALRPDGKGGIRGEAIRLKNGTATQKQVDAVVASIKSNEKLRADMIRVTKAAKEVFESSAKAMKEGRNPQWRFSNDRTAELQSLIEAMEKM
ncbi:polymorphic toxin-type HINT domain-containing protein [Streptomyces sp. NPDC004012]